MPKKSTKHSSKQSSALVAAVEKSVKSDFEVIYMKHQDYVGWPKNTPHLYQNIARKNSAAIVGAALGDEGKGRLVDNLISTFLKKPGIKKVYLVRFQGGNNAGHTVEKDGVKLALHVVPSGIFYKDVIGIMDRGMIIHPEDMQTEILYAEKHVGSLKGRLFLSNDAIMCSDLERAEEQVNKIKEGKSKGGTGRGIGPSYAHHYDKTGLRIADLLGDDWQEKLSSRYDRYLKEFSVFNVDLATSEVPDFFTTKKTGISTVRTVGDKKTFLKRLADTRAWIIKRKLVTNTFLIHQRISDDKTAAVVFEGAQAAGLDAWIGTRPDVTASNTSAYGIREGTGFWRIENIYYIIGVIKIPYTSSVGARRMPTHIDLPKNLSDLPKNRSNEQEWAAFVRETAHEYGTTTGRPRDINYIDLSLITYNARMAGVETLAITHADIARETDTIQVCTHYTDKKGNLVYYQPGLSFIADVIPHYVSLPGWDGTACQKAKTISDLPRNCLKFLAFIQKRTGFPIVVATTGPDRRNIITFPGYID